MSGTHMVGKLLVFKGGNEVLDQPKIFEFTDLSKGGMVEIAFDDRGEQLYVRIPIAEVMRILAAEHGSDS